MLSILIVDDHVMFVEGLCAFFADHSQVRVIGKCYTGSKLLEILKIQQPDVILLDISLADTNGLDLCKVVRSSYPSIKVIILSMHNEHSIISQAMKNGANAYLLKSVTGEEMNEAIIAVIDNQTYYCSEVKEILIQNLTGHRKTSQYSIIPKLSRREKEILELIVAEMTTQEIADKLCLSVKTIEAARSHMLSKLNARNIAGLVKAAYELKLLS
jgi:DNA-binding NarL/FixJ family response regulator